MKEKDEPVPQVARQPAKGDSIRHTPWIQLFSTWTTSCGRVQKKRAGDRTRDGEKERARRLPTLPRKDRSTIGVEGLDFRVRDGNGYGPLAVAAGPAYGWKHCCASALRPPADGGNGDVAKPHG